MNLPPTKEITDSSKAAGAAATPSLRLAAIDVGSNSIHMIVAQADADGGITTLWRLKEMVGLGRMSFPSRRLSVEAIDRALGVLQRFQQAALQRQCEKVIAVATSAIREAENGGDFILRARDELKLPVKVVSAREEARLIYLAVRHAMPLGKQPHFMFDIGGGSVEFIVGNQDTAMLLESRKLGAARMTATYVKSDPISDADRAALLAHYQEELAPICPRIVSLAPVTAIGTSGTLENIAAMCRDSSADEPEHADAPAGVIEVGPFKKLLDELIPSRSRDRARMRGLDDQRKDQIIAGAMLVNELFDRLKLRRIQICPMALREGMLLDYIARHVPDLEILRELPDPRRRSMIDLARRCDWHQTHSEQVSRLCMRLFDELKSLHGLGAAERELIEYGSLLHDIGWHIGGQGHHKHSMYLIQNGNLRNFTAEEIAVVANIARYHRKSPPKSRHIAYARLSRRQRRIVDIGAALLRIADGLDRSHASAVTDLKCRIEGRRVRCILSTRADAELEIWAARRKMEMFRDVFGCEIEFEIGTPQIPKSEAH
jgi:exopolyphosphatase/guanosine-5'-triphosphate,3'-diphosphate pyrophosphatase